MPPSEHASPSQLQRTELYASFVLVYLKNGNGGLENGDGCGGGGTGCFCSGGIGDRSAVIAPVVGSCWSSGWLGPLGGSLNVFCRLGRLLTAAAWVCSLS